MWHSLILFIMFIISFKIVKKSYWMKFLQNNLLIKKTCHKLNLHKHVPNNPEDCLPHETDICHYKFWNRERTWNTTVDNLDSFFYESLILKIVSTNPAHNNAAFDVLAHINSYCKDATQLFLKRNNAPPPTSHPTKPNNKKQLHCLWWTIHTSIFSDFIYCFII